MNKNLVSLLSVLFLLCLFNTANALDRYVDVNLGSNCSGNYSIANRNCTGSDGDAYTAANINSAIQASTGGDTVKIRAGTYPAISDQSITWPTTSESSVLTIEGYSSERPLVSNLNGAFNNTKSTTSYTTVRNIDFFSSVTSSNGDVINTQGHHIRFENVKANSDGSIVGCVDDNIFNVVLINSGSNNITFSGGEYHNPGDACSHPTFASRFGYIFYVTGDDIIIEDAILYNARAYAIHNYNAADTPNRNIYRRLEVYDVCQEHASCVGILLASGSDLRAENNLVRDIVGAGTGVNVSGISCANGATDCRVYNNTIVNITGGEINSGLSWGNQSGGIFRNNIMYNTGDFYDTNGTSVTRSNNRCDNSGTGCSTTANPLFTDPNNDDYTLQSGSTMIDAGVDVGLPYNGSAPDLGAYEFADSSLPTIIILLPDTDGNFSTTSSTIDVSGTASDSTAVTSVTWTCPQCVVTSGTASGTTSWSITGLQLALGDNTVTVTAHDGDLNTDSDIIVITRISSTNELVLKMVMNEGTGTSVADTSGKNNNGTTDCGWSTQGRYGNAVSFNGSCSITVPDSTSLDLNNYTLEAWVFKTTTNDNEVVIAKNTDAYYLFSAIQSYCGGDRVILGGFHNGSQNVTVCNATPLSLNVWTHLAVTYDGTSLKLYKDAVLIGSAFASTTPVVTSGILQIGSSVWNEYFTGLIDEVYVYNHARTQSQIETDMNTSSVSSGNSMTIKIGNSITIKIDSSENIKIGVQ